MGDTGFYNYVVDKDGNRVLDDKSKQDRMVSILKAGGLYPTELSTDSLSKVCYKLEKIIDVDIPTIIVSNVDIHKAVFSALLLLIHKFGKYKKDYMNFKVISNSYVTQQYLSGEYHDVSMEFDNYPILFVKVGFDDFPHMYNAHCLKNLSNARKEKGMYTFFFYVGKKEEFIDRYKVDELGGGRKEVIVDYNKKTTIDNRVLTPISKYIKVVNLNMEG